MSAVSSVVGKHDLRTDFLNRHGWGVAVPEPIGGDSARRSYFGLWQDGKTAVLMETLPDGHPQATPGHSLHDFLRIGASLHRAGLHVPEVYAADEANGFLLLEDFGNTSFKKALADGNSAYEVYALAVDILKRFRAIDPPVLPDYTQSHVHKGRRRVVDWYLPAVRGVMNRDGLAEGYLGVWEGIERGLPLCPQGFLHIDYHVENLMWIDHASGLNRCGILDFQGAMRGPLPYDLANLLEDARIDVPDDLRRSMLDRYCADMNDEDREIFQIWYRVLATQFHCRVIGQFIRLAVLENKTGYLAHLPRVRRYLHEGLEHPVLKGLRSWFQEQGVDFNDTTEINPALVKVFIRSDAF